MKKTIQIECSATLGRKERLEAFKQFVAENRKAKGYRSLIAVFALKHGLRERLVKEYIDLLIRAGVYVNHRFKLLTPSEYEKVQREIEMKEKKRKEQLEKEAEARRLEREEYVEDDFESSEASIIETEEPPEF